jgi:plasmid stabilization system protein ParE
MSRALCVIRTPRYESDLVAIGEFIEQNNPEAACELVRLIESQIDHLSDPNFPRRPGRVAGTWELVAHPNYLVLLKQTDTTVTALAVMHAARKYP